MQWPLVEDQEGRLWVGRIQIKDFTFWTVRQVGLPVMIQRLLSACWRWATLEQYGWAVIQGEIASFDPITETFTYFPLKGTWLYALLVSRSGEVWVAGFAAGLIRLDPTTGKFTSYTKVTAPEGHINDLFALSLYEDREGIIWVGSAEGGLNRLDPRTNVFTYFTTREGLPSNRVNSIIGDERGNLWLGTGPGTLPVQYDYAHLSEFF